MDLPVDRLPGALQVVTVTDAAFGDAVARGARAPHRHDYHELLWTDRGSGWHAVDGERFPVEPGTVTKYAMSAAVLMNLLLFAIASALASAIGWARTERRYQRMLAAAEAPPRAPEPAPAKPASELETRS